MHILLQMRGLGEQKDRSGEKLSIFLEQSSRVMTDSRPILKIGSEAPHGPEALGHTMRELYADTLGGILL